MAASETKYRYRAHPQMSANQIAEYLQSTPQGRTRLIRSARFPSTSVVAQYVKAREGLVHFLGDAARSIRHLADAADYLEKRQRRTDATEWIQRDSRGSLEAINTFQRSYNRLSFPKLECRPVTGRLPFLDMWPTRISVDLDVTIHVPNRDAADRIGGVVLLFSRGEPKTKARVEKCKTIAGLVLTFCGRHMKGMGEPDPSLCLAVDVINGVEHRPAGTFARGLASIESAAEEIASRWRSVSPPSDYDGPDPD